MEIRILGIGCSRCNDLEKLVRDALAELDIAADVEHIKDLKRFAAMGVLMTPGLVINGKVACQGRLPSKAELRDWLTAAA
jgi:small redox-active disulfide protein 2